ncbi:MAG: DUF364 domain-containing protein [Pseudomonadota bacterium]
MDAYKTMQERLVEVIQRNGWEKEPVKVTVRTMTPEETIGVPKDKDYPLVKGKERMMEAEFLGARGQAFTDMYGDFTGNVFETARMDLTDDFRRAVFLASLNAVLRRAGLVDQTVHCKNDDPVLCAKELVDHVARNHGRPKIALVGLQPRMLQELSKKFEIKVTDLDSDNIGREKFGIMVDGPDRTSQNLAWSDLILATGSAFCNASIIDMMTEKPIIVFGVTGAGPAALLHLNRFCPRGA